MPKLLRKYAPQIVTAAVMAWCCWSQVRSSDPLLANMDEVPLPRIDRDALRPKMSPSSPRDPFRQSAPEQPAVEEPVELVEEPPEPRFDPRTVLGDFRLDATVVGTEF